MSTATITQVTAVDGYYTARVHDGTDEIVVDNRIGPWTTPVDPFADHGSNKISRREIVPEVSGKLRELVRTGGTDAVVSFTPAKRTASSAAQTAPKLVPTPTPTTAQAIAQQMAAAGAAAVRKAAA